VVAVFSAVGRPGLQEVNVGDDAEPTGAAMFVTVLGCEFDILFSIALFAVEIFNFGGIRFIASGGLLIILDMRKL
jgi:hypothetical protein